MVVVSRGDLGPIAKGSISRSDPHVDPSGNPLWDENSAKAHRQGLRKRPNGYKKKKWIGNRNSIYKHARIKDLSEKAMVFEVTMDLGTRSLMVDQIYQGSDVLEEDVDEVSAELIVDMPAAPGYEVVGCEEYTKQMCAHCEELVGLDQGLHGVDVFRQVFHASRAEDPQEEEDVDGSNCSGKHLWLDGRSGISDELWARMDIPVDAPAWFHQDVVPGLVSDGCRSWMHFGSHPCHHG